MVAHNPRVWTLRIFLVTEMTIKYLLYMCRVLSTLSNSYISGERLALHGHAGILYRKWLCPNSQVEYVYTVTIASIFNYEKASSS